MEIKVRIAEEKNVERVSFLYERLHDYLDIIRYFITNFFLTFPSK